MIEGIGRTIADTRRKSWIDVSLSHRAIIPWGEYAMDHVTFITDVMQLPSTEWDWEPVSFLDTSIRVPSAVIAFRSQAMLEWFLLTVENKQ